MNKIIYLVLVSTFSAHAGIINLDNLEELISQELTSLEISVRSLPGDSNPDHISINHLFHYSKKFIADYVNSQGISFDGVPVSLKNKMFAACKQISHSLSLRLKNDKASFIHKSRVQNLLMGILRDFINDIPNAVAANGVTVRLESEVANFFAGNNLAIADIPTAMKPEFDARKIAAVDKLNSLMQRSYQDYVTITTIQTVVQDIFGTFIDRANYVLLWDWFSSVVNNVKNTKDRTASSYFEDTKESKQLFKKLKFLNKQKNR